MSSKKVKMIFSKDMFYNDMNKPLYCAGKIYDVEENMVARWLKRGGEVVDGTEKTKVVGEPVKEQVEAPPEKEDDDKGKAQSGPRGRGR